MAVHFSYICLCLSMTYRYICSDLKIVFVCICLYLTVSACIFCCINLYQLISIFNAPGVGSGLICLQPQPQPQSQPALHALHAQQAQGRPRSRQTPSGPS